MRKELSKRQKARRRRKQKPWLVVAAECDKGYGGREEGGWWYDISHPTQHPGNRRFATRNEALAYRSVFDDLLEAENKEERRRPPDSMACNGDWLQAQVWFRKPESLPRMRPRYE